MPKSLTILSSFLESQTEASQCQQEIYNPSQALIRSFQTSTGTLPALQSFPDFQTLASEPLPSLLSNLESRTGAKFAPALTFLTQTRVTTSTSFL